MWNLQESDSVRLGGSRGGFGVLRRKEMADVYGRVRNPEYSEEAKAFIKAQVEGYQTWQLNAAGVGRMVYFLAALVFFIVVLYEQYSKRKERLSKLPPGPFHWPYLGCLPYLRSKGGNKLSLRAKVADLAKIHGPFMFLQIADAQVVVVSSGELAKEVRLSSYSPSSELLIK